MSFLDLQAAILAEHPKLALPVDDWPVVNTLRAYATAHIDYVINVDSPYYVDQNGKPVGDRFEVFEADSGGVVCGGTADAYTELLRAWGYSAWNLGIGDLSGGGFTHMQTLVQIDVDGDTVLTLHDPSNQQSSHQRRRPGCVHCSRPVARHWAKREGGSGSGCAGGRHRARSHGPARSCTRACDANPPSRRTPEPARPVSPGSRPQSARPQGAPGR
jgi:hypothetical protein